MRRIQKRVKGWFAENLDRALNFYPPYLGAGVRVVETSDDFRYVRVEMALRFYNQNYVGTHFGGSLYSMVDPFFMLMLMKNLGSEYVVWDRAARIEFKKPGRGRVSAEFKLSEERIEEIRRRVDADRKVEPEFRVQIFNEEGDVVAEVEKTLYVRRKDR